MIKIENLKILNKLKIIETELKKQNNFLKTLSKVFNKKQNKKVSELTDIQVLEDLGYYIKYAHYQSHPNLDNTFNAVWINYLELTRRLENKKSEYNCDNCNLYGECDHQEAYQKNGKWCYD